MTMKRTKQANLSGTLLANIMALALAGCASTGSDASGTATPTSDEDLSAALGLMMSGQSQVQGAGLEAALQKAAAYPLGSSDNPVRAQGPVGQRAYLSRLRCEDLSRPAFSRAGSAGMSPYGNIVDLYMVTCAGSAPAESQVFIDMYHSGHVEEAAVPGFGIVGGRRE